MNTFDINKVNNQTPKKSEVKSGNRVLIHRVPINEGIFKVDMYDMCRLLDAETKGRFIETVGWTPLFGCVYSVDPESIIRHIAKFLIKKYPSARRRELFGENIQIDTAEDMRYYFFCVCDYTLAHISDEAVRLTEERYEYDGSSFSRKQNVKMFDI